MTKDIRHSFVIAAKPEAIAEALTRAEHIRGWWTHEATLQGGRLGAGWSGHGWVVTMDVVRNDAERNVVWRCVKSNMQNTNAWEGTTISFVFTPVEGGTRVDFAQTGYRESPCYVLCVQGWAYFLGTSLKGYLETGKGTPYPEITDTNQGK